MLDTRALSQRLLLRPEAWSPDCAEIEIRTKDLTGEPLHIPVKATDNVSLGRNTLLDLYSAQLRGETSPSIQQALACLYSPNTLRLSLTDDDGQTELLSHQHLSLRSNPHDSNTCLLTGQGENGVVLCHPADNAKQAPETTTLIPAGREDTLHSDCVILLPLRFEPNWLLLEWRPDTRPGEITVQLRTYHDPQLWDTWSHQIYEHQRSSLRYKAVCDSLSGSGIVNC